VSQTKTASVAKGSTSRKNFVTDATSGAGASKRFYVGRKGNYDYTSHMRFDLDATFWSGVGSIVSAVLTLYGDDGLGVLGAFIDEDDHPKIYVLRLFEGFSEDTDSAVFTSADYEAPAYTTTGKKTVNPTAAILDALNVDITDMVRNWAPSTVAGGKGSQADASARNHGLMLKGTTDAKENWAAVSEDTVLEGLDAYKPVLTLTYEYGLTVPTTPTNLSPSGAVAALTDFEGDFADSKSTDVLRFSNVQVYTNEVTASGQDITLNGGSKVYDKTQAESNAAMLAARFSHAPVALGLTRNTNYKWRARVQDQEGQWSLWTALTTFSVTNTAPANPILSPLSASSFASLDGVQFASLYSDPDGDALLAFQVQLSAYAEGDAHWDDDAFILWNTGKRFVASGDTSWQTPYGGDSLAAGTYYWRARHYDIHEGLSNWVYATIVLTADFVVSPEDSTNRIQLRPRAPWRIVIKGLGTNRGPGSTVAILEDATNVGASIVYNSPGEAHWTLVGTHPQISVIEPRQTHYAIEFRQGDGWREVFAGLVIDFDATANDVVFYGLDYLGLLGMDVDEHYDPAHPDLPAEKGGSKYVTAGKNTPTYIITNQLKRAREVANSLVGFIATGSIASMTETLTLYTTYQPYLSTIVGLLDSHRAGTGKRSRISVKKTTAGGYEFVVVDDPGVTRDNLRLRFGEMVQGYRVIPFGKDWATRVAGIGRDKDGVLVRYKSLTSAGIDESVWGRWVSPQFFDGTADANDFARKVKQAATAAAKLGKQIAVGLRSGVLQPRDGYDICDLFPIDIEHQAVSTSAFGSGYWAALAITWTALQQGDLNTILTLAPREDTVAPDSDLLTLSPISGQAEWQIGWTSPNPLAATSKYWLDQTTGKVYLREAGATLVEGITGDV
jgi:hypothetical protein